MKRVLAVTFVLAAAAAYVLTSAGAKEETGNRYTVEFDKGERKPSGSDPGCYVANKLQFGGRLQGQFPHVEADDYSRGE